MAQEGGSDVVDSEATACVSAGLLSAAKDRRYIRQVQACLRDAMESFLGRHQQHEERENLSYFLSEVLSILFVVARTGRTLGMDVCGISFQNKSYASARLRLASCLLLSSSVAFYLRNRKQQQPNHQQENLRGEQRRRYHDQIRRRMIENRGHNHKKNLSHSTDGGANGSRTAKTSRTSRMLHWIVNFFTDICTSVADVELGEQDGPHEVAPSTASQGHFSVGRWIVRLHLAYFCIYGKYPSPLYRIFGYALARDMKEEKGAAFQSPLPRIVGGIILAQAAVVGLRWLVNESSRALINISHSYTKRLSPSENKEHYDETAPQATNAAPLMFAPAGKVATCTICRMDRVHPAAPIACGHVACWSCLMHWVSTVRPECPLCRAPCRPQNIIALHSYLPLEEAHE